ncbi:hypothetical protein [Sulfitobacter aestuariivivens]|uniref:Antibiotic biosynthesis monooxygenase n=1 Tax=Sulfitobacter aestuariivivens TaxID=2766981 RepID=A0A927HEM4_9RHOB|nr:hypothetical protein [Sulfitobacter aestuariivivens]MBD3663534.1 hypothetical protein [Sulfitobacter aestuariivivens]
MSQTQNIIAEIVTFRLTEGSDPQAFVAAARAIEPMLHAGGHTLSRTLSRDADGLWTDHIIWTSAEAAKAMAEKIMSAPDAAPMMQMIDPEGVVMRHAEIFHLQE